MVKKLLWEPVLPLQWCLSLWFGAVGEGEVLPPKAPRGLCAGDSGPRAVPV